MKKSRQPTPKKILLLEPDKHAPYVAAADAARLTNIGETAVRSLKLRRFGKTDYVKVTELNDFILNGIQPTPLESAPMESLDRIEATALVQR